MRHRSRQRSSGRRCSARSRRRRTRARRPARQRRGPPSSRWWDGDRGVPPGRGAPALLVPGPVRLVVDRPAALVLHDVPLVVELLLGHRRQEAGEPIGLEPGPPPARGWAACRSSSCDRARWRRSTRRRRPGPGRSARPWRRRSPGTSCALAKRRSCAGFSCRLPTSYHRLTATIGARSSRDRMTRRPFGSVAIDGDMGHGADPREADVDERRKATTRRQSIGNRPM